MTRTFNFATLPIAVIILLLSPLANAQNLIQNAGMETATIGPPMGNPIAPYPGTTDFWSATVADGELILDPPNAYNGNSYLSALQNPGANTQPPFTGSHLGGVGFDKPGQVVAVNPNTTYDLSFFHRHGDGSRYGYTSGDMLLEVYELQPTVSLITNSITAAPAAWSPFSTSFTTNAATTEIFIMFSIIASNSADLWIDDVDLRERRASGLITTRCDGFWNDPDIWTGGLVPAAGDSIRVNHRVRYTSAMTFNNNDLYVSPTGDLCGTFDLTFPAGSPSIIAGQLSASTVTLSDFMTVSGQLNTAFFTASGGFLQVTISGQGVIGPYSCTPVYNTTTLADITICPGDSVLLFGNYVKAAGTYNGIDTLPGGGCKLSITVDVVFPPAVTTALPDLNICSGPVIIFGTTISMPGIYYDTLRGMVNCDSILEQRVLPCIPPPLSGGSFSADTLVTDVSCYGGNDGSITFGLLGDGPLDYSWSDGDMGTTLGACAYHVALNNAGTSQTDFQIPIRLGRTADMDVDFGDVRFVDSTGNNYTYWLEDYPVADTAIFWVLLPNIPPGNFGFFLNFCAENATTTSDAQGTFDFFDDFDDGDVSDWTSGCQRALSTGEFCTQGVSTTNWSPSFSMELEQNSSCFVAPYNGSASTMERNVALTNYDYVIDYDDRITVELFGFCSGGTNGTNRSFADGTNLGNGSGASRGGSCGSNTNGWNSQTSNNFNVSTGTALIQLQTSGGDCAVSTGWFDNVRIRRWSPDPITVSLSGAAPIVKSPLSAGTYTVTVTDANGGVFIDSLTVNEPDSLALNPGFSPIACSSPNSGEAFVAPAGGTPIYTIAWNNSATTDTIGGLSAGTYSVTVTDANGCADSTSLTISGAVGLTATLATTDVNCFGGNDGTVQASPSGGASPYNYLWSNSDVTALTTVAAGTYTVTITDNGGCTTIDSAIVTEPTAALTLAFNGSDVTCIGNSNGTAEVLPSGGTPGYQYSWSNSQVQSSINGLVADTYTITVTDANSCTAIDSFVVAEPLLGLSAVVDSLELDCFADSTASLVATASNGVAPLSYIWNTGAGSNILNGLGEGTYTVTVSDASGCTAEAIGLITEPTILELVWDSVAATCEGADDGFAAASVAGGTLPYDILWNNGATTLTQQGLAGDTYTLTVTDSNGCVISDSIVVESNLITGDIIADPDTLIAVGETTELVLNTSSMVNSIIWTPSDYLNNTDNDTVVVIATEFDTLTYTATFTDDNGCVGTDTITIYIDKEPNFFAPNVFTPNGDGVNDEMQIFTAGAYRIQRLQIFDRWGELIFDSTDTNASWDGTFKGKQMNAGVYVYRAALQRGRETSSRNIEWVQGSVTLIR